MKLNTLFKSAVFGAIFGLSASASANLITNGSFEDNDIATGTWQWFSANDVNGWNGSNIEIWDNLFGEAAYEGDQFIELNAHPVPQTSFSIYQDFNTIVGETYSVSFAYQARNSTDESFLASIAGASGLITEWILEDHTTTGWSVLSSSFIADSTTSTIRFTSLDALDDTTGNFLDDVQVAAVSEPGTFALLGLGMVGLGLRA